MNQAAAPAAVLLDAAVSGEALALLQLSRRLGKLFHGLGAYTIQKDWTRTIREISLAAVRDWPSARSGGDEFLLSLARNVFWGRVLDLMTENNTRAGELFFPTVRRLVSSWDGSRKAEAHWDDIASETATQLWTQWQKGGVEKPWSLLCTIARRRYLDRTRAARPMDDIDDLQDRAAERAEGEAEPLFTEEVLAVLEEHELDVIVRMDIQGETRVEIAEALGLSPGQVLSIRRAGLRRIWRFLGSRMPPRLRKVWDEMFKGAQRRTPEQVAAKLKFPLGDVVNSLEEARQLTGLPFS